MYIHNGKQQCRHALQENLARHRRAKMSPMEKAKNGLIFLVIKIKKLKQKT